MKKLICKLFGHKYIRIRKINFDIEKVFCERCLSEFGIHHGLKTILPLDNDLRNAHKIILNK